MPTLRTIYYETPLAEQEGSATALESTLGGYRGQPWKWRYDTGSQYRGWSWPNGKGLSGLFGYSILNRRRRAAYERGKKTTELGEDRDVKDRVDDTTYFLLITPFHVPYGYLPHLNELMNLN